MRGRPGGSIVMACLLATGLAAGCADDDDPEAQEPDVADVPDVPLEVDEVLDELDCTVNDEDLPSIIVENHLCRIDGTRVRIHVFTSVESRGRTIDYLDNRYVGNPCPDGSTATFVAVDGTDWVVVAPDRSTADLVATRTGGDVIPVPDDAGVPISYDLPATCPTG